MHDAVGEAARRYARLQAPDCTDEERAECTRWRCEQPEHERAWAAVTGLDAGVRARAPLDRRLQRAAEAAWRDSPRATDVENRAWQPGGWLVPAAAAMVLAVMASLVSVGGKSETDEPFARLSAGSEPRRVVLEDGSVMQLDLDTEVGVNMTGRARTVVLHAGRAVFDVAPDSARPFTVNTAEGSAVAIGTRFQVELDDGLAVLLEEGAVDVLARGLSGRQRLEPGERARLMQDGSGWHRESVDAQALMSWARGRHVFRARPLREALTEINRYSAIPVRLGDPLIEDLVVSGSFVAGDSRMIVAALTAALPLRAVDAGNELVLFANYGERRVAPAPGGL